MGGTNLPRVRDYNQAVVLEAIRVRGLVSRIELASLTGLTNQTISNVVRRLLDAGLVSESGQERSDGGKPRTLLSPRPEGAFAVGVHLDPNSAVIVVVNLAGEVLAGKRIRLTAPRDPADVVKRIARVARTLIAKTEVDAARLLGVGIAAPGPIDGATGAVVSPPNFPGWGRVPLRDMFSVAMDMPAALDNDATAAAIGERWIGGKARAGSFLFIYLGTGIGAGIVLNGTVLHGDSGNAGEFGHMGVESGRRVCHCGSTNCLFPYRSPAAIIGDLVDQYGQDVADRIGLAGTPESVQGDWKLLRQAVHRGDPAACDVVRQAARRIGQAARGAVSLLDVSLVVLGGEALRGIEPILCEEIDLAVNATPVARSIGKVAVEKSLIGDTVGAVGAASLILDGNYSPGLRMLTEVPGKLAQSAR